MLYNILTILYNERKKRLEMINDVALKHYSYITQQEIMGINRLLKTGSLFLVVNNIVEPELACNNKAEQYC